MRGQTVSSQDLSQIHNYNCNACYKALPLPRRYNKSAP